MHSEILGKLKNAFNVEKELVKKLKDYQDNGINYKNKIQIYLNLQRENLITLAEKRGINEMHVRDYLNQN